MTPARAGLSMIELLAILAFVLPLAMMGLGIATNLANSGAPASGAQLDLLCEQLRREAAGGVRIEAETLLIGRHRWSHGDGWLSCDGARRLAATAAWRSSGTGVLLELQPAHLPARQLLLQVRP